MEQTTLKATRRQHLGHAAKKLRAQKQLPVTLYGKKIENLTLAVDLEEFKKVFAKTGATGLISLELAGELRPVLIHHVQFEPLTQAPLHVEFYQVNLAEKVQASVPVKIVGESPVVAANQGLLLTLIDEVLVESLPADLPDHLEVDVSGLLEVNQELTVGQIKMSPGVSIVTLPEQPVVRVGELIVKVIEEVPTPTLSPTEGATEGENSQGTETAPAQQAQAEN